MPMHGIKVFFRSEGASLYFWNSIARNEASIKENRDNANKNSIPFISTACTEMPKKSNSGEITMLLNSHDIGAVKRSATREF